MSSTVLEPRHGSIPSLSEFDAFADLRKELDQLSAANREILDELRSDPALNAEALAETPVYTAAQWEEREQAHQAALEENAEVIRHLQTELDRIREEGLPELSPEEVHDAAVKRLHRDLEEHRRQLQEDEENLMRQLREMELTLVRDRAELARERADFQRLHNDFQRELEHASRQSELRDRLAGLQRRHLDGRRVSDPELARAAGPVSVNAQTPVPAQLQEQPAPERAKPSGLFRRLFSS